MGRIIVVLTPYLGQLLEIQQLTKITGSANTRIDREDIDDLHSAEEHVEEEHYDFFYGSDGPRAVRISTINNFQDQEPHFAGLFHRAQQRQRPHWPHEGTWTRQCHATPRTVWFDHAR